MEQPRRIELENGETLAYRHREGGSVPLVLLHGNLNASVQWDLLFEHLDERFTLYAPDLRGFGESSYESPIETMEDFAEDVRLFVDALGLQTFHLAGLSIGAAVAMRVTLDVPKRVDKLILLASAPAHGRIIRKRRLLGMLRGNPPIDSLQDMRKHVKPLERLRNQGNPSGLKRVLNASIYTKDKPHDRRYDAYIDALLKQQNLPEVNLALARFNITDRHNGLREGTKEAASIKCPVLMLHGDSDRVFPAHEAETTRAAIGENAELEILNNTSHAILVDAVRTIRDRIDAFL